MEGEERRGRGRKFALRKERCERSRYWGLKSVVKEGELGTRWELLAGEQFEPLKERLLRELWFYGFYGV